jgi:predicted anti-sigma-YlaC factor YlaD
METSDIFSDQARAHPDEEILERYALGQCTEAECELVEEHILICASCRNALNDCDNWIQLMKTELPAANQPQPENSSFWTKFRNRRSGGFSAVPAMAGAAFALAMVLWVGMPGSRTPTSEIHLSAIRGNELSATAPANTEVRLKLEQANSGGADLNNHTATIVDSQGVTIWRGIVRDAAVVTPKLSSGSYWVRIYRPSGEQVKEYGLLVK